MKLTTFDGFDIDRLPQERIFAVGEGEYRFRMDYNSRGEFFTLRILDNKSGELLFITRLLYFSPVFTLYVDENFRDWFVVPLDPLDLQKGFKQHDALTKENFYQGVQLARVEP